MAGSSSSMSSASASVSGGISTSTGRGRPVLSCRNASCTAEGTSPAFTTRAAHFVTDFTASSWSSISCSIPRFTPMRSRGICPATSSTGDDAEYAVDSPEVAFSTPGPGTTIAVPMPPPARA